MGDPVFSPPLLFQSQLLAEYVVSYKFILFGLLLHMLQVLLRTILLVKG